MKRISITLMACIGFLYMLSGCNRDKDNLISKTDFYFDTVITISINSDDTKVLDECFALCDEIEKTFSKTLPSSELYAINHRRDNQLTVSSEMAFLISEGLRYYALSDGMFDISIAPVQELWDFKSDAHTVPNQDEIKTALEAVDAAGIHLDGNLLSFENSAAQIDLGALVKGYAADRIKEYLVAQGVTSGMINLGGNVLTIGKKTDGDRWTVGIQKPFADRNEIITTVQADGDSVVSSGVYERYFNKDGRLYHHILDPHTGYPVATDLWQATIISTESLQGDALSTISVLLGQERATKLLTTMDGIEFKFVTNDGALVE